MRASNTVAVLVLVLSVCNGCCRTVLGHREQLRTRQEIVHGARRISLHGRRYVRIEIQRNRDGRVAEHLGDDLGVDSLPEQQRRRRVPQVVLVPTSAQTRLCRPPRYADIGQEVGVM